MSSRRERFREYMARLSPAAHPREAIRDDLYVPRPGAVADQLARRLELEPSSSHLLVGGVGSGKTTQLLVAQKRLAEVPDISAVFLDVSEKHDIAQLRSGVLVVLAGLTLGTLVNLKSASHEVKRAQRRFQKWAHGSLEWVDMRDQYQYDEPPDEPYDDDQQYMEPVKVEGILVPPEPALQTDIQEKGQQLAILRQAPEIASTHIVLIFDSLDRLTDLKAFAEVVEQDARAIKAAGIGVIIVGPLQTLFGTRRTITDRFDYLYHQSVVDVEQDEAGQQFLSRVVRKRVGSEVLPDDSLQAIVQLSGGVLRDLISMARAAGEEAYIDGADHVGLKHVEAAADAFGRTLMLGLGPDEIKVLQRLRTGRVFVPTSDKDVALLATRRVLEYGSGGQRYAVHPTIAALLAQIATET